MLGQSDLVLIASMSKAKLHGLILGMKAIRVLEYRREVQKALTEYSRTHRGDDAVKQGAVEACQQFERWFRDGYYTWRKYKIWHEHPEWPLQSVKTEIRQEVEALIAKYNY